MAFVGSTPELFKKWLKDTLVRFKPFSKEENLVFINAWNEWAEGNHLDLIKNGEDGIWKLQKKQYLKQVKNKVL